MFEQGNRFRQEGTVWKSFMKWNLEDLESD